MAMLKPILLSIVFCTFYLTPLHAGPKLIGTYSHWRAYTNTEKGHKVCYCTSTPTKQEGNYKRRGEVYMIIAHRPYMDSYNVISFDAGYPFKSNEKVKVKIDRKNFSLFTEGETAWAIDPKTDRDLTSAIKKGNLITVNGRSSRGTATTDTYSLKGSAQAYKAICNACNFKG